MATDLFPPEADEPLFSVISRYADEMRVQNWPGFLKSLFGYRAYFSPALAYNLSFVARSTAATWEVSPRQIAEAHTLFPFYAAFVTRGQAETMLDLLVVRRTRVLAAFMPKLIQLPRVVWICDACLAEDGAGRNPMHFRRVHQVPGVVVCPRHGLWLRGLGYRSSATMPWPRIQDARMYAQAISFDATPEQLENLARVARAAQYLLESQIMVDAERLCQTCWQTLHDGGFAHGRDALSMHRVVRAFTSFYGERYLQLINLLPATHQNWVACRLGGRQRACCALPNLLLGLFCGQVATADIVVEPWPSCPNHLASHGPGHKVEIREWHDGRYYARCRCGHGFTYQAVVHGEPVDVTTTVYGPDYASRARSLFSAGVRIAGIARELQMSETTARRMVYGAASGALPNRQESAAQLRSRWLRARREHGSVRMTAVMEPGLWKALRRYAPEVLSRSHRTARRVNAVVEPDVGASHRSRNTHRVKD